MALSGLDIYKLLPKTNCRDCGFATCLAFAMQLAKKAAAIEKCPHIKPEAKLALEVSAQPPVKLVSIGLGEEKLDIGNETVLFRHEEKFRNPCGIGFIIEDSLSDAEIKNRLAKINKFKFERVGQEIKVNLVAIKQSKDKNRFVEAAKLVSLNTKFGIVLMSEDLTALEEALKIIAGFKPLIYRATEKNIAQTAKLAKDFNCPLVVSASQLETLANLVKEASSLGAAEIILDTGIKPVSQKISDLTQIRRQALKKNNRLFGYPVLAIADSNDPYEEAMLAATYISKYAGIVLIKGANEADVISILTLRQNIYTDPQKPLQIEPKLYPIGAVTKNSPVLVTTNFSLSYYTVLGEVEASKVPSYILGIDTEGMSVLTAWAAEKFTPDKISQSLDQFNVADTVGHKNLIIPGYVAMMSGDLEEKSGWKIIVGPKEAAGIPSFLKNL
ncbi:MAG: acetyl-CoA decarbonylase/synthase complex subunit gamma [Candidatus Omnitrophota bacterium]